MKLKINKFTDFSIERMVLFEMFEIKIKNKHFKYNFVLEINSDELENIVDNTEKLIRNDLSRKKTLSFENKQIAITLWPESTNGKIEMAWEFFIRDDKNDIVSSYSLRLKRDDIIELYMYLCEVMEKESQIDIPEYYEYMFTYLRSIDENDENKYCYLSDDPDVKVGDHVLIEVKKEEKEAIVEQIEYYTEKNIPKKIDKMKKIIRKIHKREKSIDDDENYESIREFKELKKDMISLRDLLANQNRKLSIREFMRTMLRENIYSEAYYNPKMNLIIESMGDVYFLPKYGRKIFKNSEFEDIINKSFTIYAYSGTNILDVHEKAISICEENRWDYIDDFEYEATYISERYCKINKIIDNQKQDLTDDTLSNHVCSEVYKKLQIYVRDSDMLNKTINIYKDNVGKLIKAKELVDCSNKIGGMKKNTRTFIVGNNIKDMSVFEKGTNWGRSVAEKNSCFKILSAGSFENKNYVILLNINKNYAKLMKSLHTNVDENISEECKKIFIKYMNIEGRKELNENWYQRLFLPVGINKNENIEEY